LGKLLTVVTGMLTFTAADRGKEAPA
jgi:hypothetical protein